MKVYNSHFFKNKQRFPRAIIVGILSAIGCAILIALYEIINPIPISFTPLLYIAAAYAISMLIKEYGHGVEPKYSALGVACFVLCFLLSRVLGAVFAYGFHLQFITFYLQVAFRSLFSFSYNSIILLASLAYSIYIAYYNSRII